MSVTLKDLQDSMDHTMDRIRNWPDGKKDKEVQEILSDAHGPNCQCDVFSDCYKDFYKHRPRGSEGPQTCAEIVAWFDEHYVLVDGVYEPRPELRDLWEE